MEMQPVNPSKSQDAFFELGAAPESLINQCLHVKHKLIEGCAAAAAASVILLPDFSALVFAL